MRSLAPIGIFTYSRKNHLEETVNALKNNTLANKSELYIFSDAAKAKDEEKIKNIREYIHTINGFKAVNIIERETNGYIKNYRNGIKQLLDEYGRSIILEDDIVTSSKFLQFMNDALDFFEPNMNILAISGYNVPVNFPERYKYEYYLSYYFNAWGYATWADRGFIEILENKKFFNEVVNDNILYNKINKYHPKLVSGLKNIQDGKLDAPDYNLVFHSIKNDFFTIKPIYSYIKNIGHDGSGIHCVKNEKFDKFFSQNSKKVMFNNSVKYQFEIDQLFYRYFHPFDLSENIKITHSVYPKTLNFLVNDVCNSRCKMCMVWNQKRDKEITAEEFSHVLEDPLFSELNYIGVSGGEPTLREDLPDFFQAITNKKGIKGTGIITNGLNAGKVIDQINKCAATCKSANLPFNVMVSLDGIGKIHDTVRGRKGAFQNALQVIRYIRNHMNIEISIGCTVIKQNVWHLDEVLEFCIKENVYGKFRIGEFINRLYNKDLNSNIRNFDSDERYQIALFFSKLELCYEKSEEIKQTYRNIRQMIFEEKPRESECPYISQAVGLDSRGNLLFCSPKSPNLGSCIEKSAAIIYEQAQPIRESTIKQYCGNCIHDYHGAPSKEYLTEKAQDKLMQNAMSVHQSIYNSTKQTDAQPEYLKWSKFQNALIIGWYGTETIGDKAIVGDIIKRLKIENPRIKITIASLYPFVTIRTLYELGEEDIEIVKTYSQEYIKACQSSDVVIMGGGPLMGMEPLGFVLTAFTEARKVNIPCIIEGCGIGPLSKSEHIFAVKEIIRLSSQIRIRDKASIKWINRNTSRLDAICTGDPAARYVEQWKNEALNGKKFVKERYFACFLREITLEYANCKSHNSFLKFKKRFEEELGALICYIHKKTGLKALLMPMHTFTVGQDDREFARKFAQKYLQVGKYAIGGKVYSPQDILSVMFSSQLNLCMRFHSVLFAEKLGTPFIAIDYTGGGKVKGFLEDQNKLNLMLDRTAISDGQWRDQIESILIKHNLKPIKVVHLSFQDSGGAGKAAYRLHKGLESIGFDSKMIVLNKKSRDPSVKVLPVSYLGRMQDCLNVSKYNSPISSQVNERWQKSLLKYPKRPTGLEMFTDAESSIRLDLIREIQEADIINLHWVAGTLDYLNAALALKDKILVWTLHDMNPFTGGCHYSGDCQKYMVSCCACPQLGSDDVNDLSKKNMIKKRFAYQSLKLNIVAPSRWLGECTKQSALLSHTHVDIIPNGLPLDTYKPYPKKQSRKAFGISENAKIILFGADSVSNNRKGFVYLLEALNRFSLNKDHQYIIVTFGRLPQGIHFPSKYQVLNTGQISNENQLAMIYSAADVFVIPSLEDNLPNTVIEAMACGLPVVGFNIGGVPDMVEHGTTGYLAKPKDIFDLFQGIEWIITSCDNGVDFSHRCRQRAEQKFACDFQAQAYGDLYRQLVR